MAEVQILGNFIFRKATIKDLKDILMLNFELFKCVYKKFDKTLNLNWTYGKIGKKYFKSTIGEKYGFIEIVEYKKKIIGYICGGRHKRSLWRIEAKYAELENMLIREDFRDKGLGSRLVKDFICWCRQNKVDYVSVLADARNVDAVSFYKNLGFKDHKLILERKI